MTPPCISGGKAPLPLIPVAGGVGDHPPPAPNAEAKTRALHPEAHSLRARSTAARAPYLQRLFQRWPHWIRDVKLFFKSSTYWTFIPSQRNQGRFVVLEPKTWIIWPPTMSCTFLTAGKNTTARSGASIWRNHIPPTWPLTALGPALTGRSTGRMSLNLQAAPALISFSEGIPCVISPLAVLAVGAMAPQLRSWLCFYPDGPV